MQCTDNSGCLPWGKREGTVRRYPAGFCFPCAVFMCFRTSGCEAYSFTTDGYGIFNVRTHLGACRTHEEGSDTNKPAQELTRREKRTVPHPAQPGDRTQGFQVWIPTLLPLSCVPRTGKSGIWMFSRVFSSSAFLHRRGSVCDRF